MAVIAWEALLFTLFPLVGGLLGSWITRKNIKTWYDVSICNTIMSDQTITGN